VILIDKTDGLVEKGMRILSEEMDKKIEKLGLTRRRREQYSPGCEAPST
jgi:hypothetical protein